MPARRCDVLIRFIALAALLFSSVGAGPAAAKPYSYIAVHDQSVVRVFDHGINAWLPPIGVGSAPVAVAADAAQRRVYVSNFSGNSVTVIRTANRSIIATIPVGARPMGIAVSPMQPRAYVANFADGTLSVIDTDTNAVVATIPVGGLPTGVAMSATGDRVFVTNTGDDTVSVVSTASNTVQQTLPNLGSRPYAVAHLANATASRLLVVHNNSARVSVLDGASFAALGTLAVGAHPTAVAAVNANKAYVLNSFDGTFSVIDPFALTVSAASNALPFAASLAVSSDGSFAALTAYPDKLSTLNTTSNAVAALPTIPGSPRAPLTLGAFVLIPSYECALDINADSTFDALDAALLTRYLLGFRGASLVAGYPALNATTTAAFIASLNLDADGDGVAIAPTDGLLLARAALGVATDAALIANARNTAFPGVRTALQIRQWIAATHGPNCVPPP